MCHTYLGFILFCLGEFQAARASFQEMIAFYEPQQHHRTLILLRGSDLGLSALAYDTCCLWCLGYPEQASKRSQEAMALARELGHPFSLGDVLCYAGCMYSEMRQDALALKGHANELMRLASEKTPVWAPPAQRFRGGALAMLGQVIDRYHAANDRSFADLGISFDIYGRTSWPLHTETTQTFFTNITDKPGICGWLDTVCTHRIGNGE